MATDASKARTAKGPAVAGPRGASAPAPAASRADSASVQASDVRQDPPIEEPVWLVRTVLVLFLVGFAVFLAREVRYALETFP